MPARPTRKQVAVWSAVLTVFGLLVWASLPKSPVEPEWKGKTLSEWLNSAGFSGSYFHRSTGESGEAFEAIRVMGTNCLPWLLARLSPFEQPGRIQVWLDEIAYKMAENGTRVPWMSAETRQIRRRGQALEAFSVLGRLGEPALPDLEAGLFMRNLKLDGRASAQALAGISERGVLLLLTAVTIANATVRQNAICGLAQPVALNEQALAALQNAVRDGDAGVRAHAAVSFGSYTNDSPVVVPALAKLLSDMNKTVRRASAYALASYKADITTAIPALEIAARDSDELIRSSAEGALDAARKYSRAAP